MISIIITSYNEPKATKKAIECFLSQKIKEEMKIIIVDPFPEVGEFLKKNVKDKRVEFFLDPGEGKSYALNLLFEMLFSENKDHIIIFSDGDVFVSKNSISEILKKFKDPLVGCVTGRPIAIDSTKTKYGYWAKLLFDGIDRVRKKHTKKNKFIQASGYLFAIRNGLIKEIPLDVPEDCIIPYMVWKNEYKIAYADKAEVYIKYPDNWKDWLSQRTRIIKAHENISKIAPDMPRTKSFFNEIKEGALFAIIQPRNTKELFWVLELFLARLHIYLISFMEMKKKKAFNPAWRDVEIKSTKTLD